ALAGARGRGARRVRRVVREGVHVVVLAVRADRAVRAARAVVGLVVVGRRRAARIVRVVDLAVGVVVDAVVALRLLAGPAARGALARVARAAGERAGLGERALARRAGGDRARHRHAVRAVLDARVAVDDDEVAAAGEVGRRGGRLAARELDAAAARVEERHL